MMFDHVAVLLDEPGAGTPEEGVASLTQKVMSSRSKLLALLMVSTAPAKVCSTRPNSSSPTPQLLFDDISRAISDKLREGDTEDKWLWPKRCARQLHLPR